MRLTLSAIGLAIAFGASSVMAGEFSDHCAWGLANGKKVKTDCSINMTGPDGKTYCFSNEQVKWEFAADPVKYSKAATDTYKK